MIFTTRSSCNKTTTASVIIKAHSIAVIKKYITKTRKTRIIPLSSIVRLRTYHSIMLVLIVKKRMAVLEVKKKEI